MTDAPGQAAPGDGGAEIDVESIRVLELRHRMKNMLSIVQAVAHQTLRSGRTIEEARRALDGRLAAMGKAVDMLLHTAWTEAGLRALIDRALVHGRSGPGGRVDVAGPDLVVGPDAAMALSLVFHELESNSIKYGAMAHDDGKVVIAWSVAPGPGGDWLSLEWAEHDGPPCIVPSHQGFGSRMIAKLIGGRFGGSAETDYRPDGLRWRLSAPLAGLAR